jgi:hypothetical protein
MVLSGVLASSCTKQYICPPNIKKTKNKRTANRKEVRKVLRKDYHYHQTRVGRILKFNLF